MGFQTALGNSPVSDADWDKILRNNELNAARKNQAKEQAKKLGNVFYSWQGVDGARGSGIIGEGGWDGFSSPSSQSGGKINGNNLTNSNNSLLSSLGLGTDGNLFDAAKDMARFRLGLDQEQGRFARGLREEEAQSNFGRTTKLTAQQLTGQQDLEGLRQDAMTQRNTDQLANNLDMLNTGNNFNLLILGKNRAAALRGLR